MAKVGWFALHGKEQRVAREEEGKTHWKKDEKKERRKELK